MFDLIPFKKNNKLVEDTNNIMDTLFDDNFFKMSSTILNRFKVDVKETEKEYIIEAELPGYNKEDIELIYKDNYLTISAKKDTKEENKKENYIRQERYTGETKRSFYIDNILEDKIDAEFKNGILKVVLPFIDKEKTTKKNIEIK